MEPLLPGFCYHVNNKEMQLVVIKGYRTPEIMNNMLTPTATPSMTTTSTIIFMQIAHKWVTNAYIS